ncbi:MAG: serine hydrolase, partial [Chloroflexota bacterium]
LREAQAQWAAKAWWLDYLSFVVGRPFAPVQVELQATHDPAVLAEVVQTAAGFLDQPARPPQIVPASLTFQAGTPGFQTNVAASLEGVTAALYRPTEREAPLLVEAQAATPPDMSLLERYISGRLQTFNGLGSVFIIDLQTGEEVAINADLAISGMSMVKIAILLETFRRLDQPPDLDQTKLISETAVLSGNYSANLLLDIVAGQDNAYLGVDILTESMRRLGLVNTFIAVPYEEPARAGLYTYVTPANSRTDLSANPDPSMQTTAEELGTLLSMIYYCAQGGGPLLAVYADQLTPEECQTQLRFMERNHIGSLIEAGVPPTTLVAHKHGWIGDTHGDGGIVFTAGGDYVLVEYLYHPDWLEWGVSSPLLADFSRATYNYFNFDNPYLGNTTEAVTAGNQNAPVDMTQVEDQVR